MDRPYTKSVDADLLCHPLLGLYGEASHWQDEAVLESWIKLINTYVRRALVGGGVDPRLRRLWRKVEGSLGAQWDCRSMAEIAGVSEEHLRRLSHQAHSQSPMQRLKSLRMNYVAELLAYSNLSIEKISEEVGYTDAASLARAFQQSLGVPPGRYRRRVRSATRVDSERAS